MSDNTQVSIFRHDLAVALPRDGSAPEWIELFSSVGEVRTRDGRQFRIDWLAEGRELLAQKRYRDISPPTQATKDGAALRIMAAALVTAPALAQQSALASAHPSCTSELTMKTIALDHSNGLRRSKVRKRVCSRTSCPALQNLLSRDNRPNLSAI